MLASLTKILLKLMMHQDKSKIAIYGSFLLFKLVNGLLFSTSIYFFVDDSTVTSLISFLIVQEFYLSYFYVAKKNQHIQTGKRFPRFYFIITSLLVFIFVALFTKLAFDVLFYFALAFCLICFPYYATVAPIGERVDVTRWVKYENLSAFSSVILVSTTLGISHMLDFDADFFALMRLGFMYLFSLFFFYRHFKGTLKKVESNTWVDFIKTSDVIIILLVFKLLYFEYSIQLGELDGKLIKVYLIIYDVSSALIALFIRRTISLHKASFSEVRKILLYLNIVFSLIYLGSATVFSSLSPISNSIQATILFLSIAVNYNVFSIDGFKGLNYKKGFYIAFVAGVFISESLNYSWVVIFFNLAFIYKQKDSKSC